MQIERALCGVTTLGPGQRLAVWVNGCGRRCRGCVSPRLQRRAPENECDVDAYFADFDLTAPDGVTISGGEPFDQASELLRALRLFRSHGIEDILVYTGYTIEELRERGDSDTTAALAETAVLIDGPYLAERDLGCGNLAGSENQRIHYLDPRMRERYEAYQRKERRMQEFSFCGHVIAVGIPTDAYIRNFLKNGEG